MDTVFLPAMQAIYTGELDVLRSLLAQDPGLASRNSSCSHPTLLQFVAVESGLGKIDQAVAAATLLLDHGASAQRALLAAASTASADVLALLVERGADLNEGEWRALDECLYWSHTALASQLVEQGAEVHRLRSAAGLGLGDTVRAFFDDGRPVHRCGPIASPFDDCVDPTTMSEPQHVIDHALVFAVLNDQHEIAQFLVDAGADVNGKPTGFHWRGTALHAAIWRGNERMVEWLLNRGADPSITDDAYGGDAEGWARHNDHGHIIALLRSS